MKKKLSVILSILFSLVLCSTLITPAFAATSPHTSDFSDLTIYDVQGKDYTLGNDKSDVTVLVIGRVSCGYSTEAFNNTLDIFGQFGIENGSVYFLDVDSKRSDVQNFAQDIPPFAHLAWSGSSEEYDDLFWSAVQACNGPVYQATFPAIFVLDKNGQCIYYSTFDTFNINELKAALSTYSTVTSGEGIYNTSDYIDLEFTDAALAKLDSVTNASTAREVVEGMAKGMTTLSKETPAIVDMATLYAENVVAKAASKQLNQSEVVVSADSVSDLGQMAAQVSREVESALTVNGVATFREISNMVTLTTNATGVITIKIAPDVLTTNVDKVRIETPSYAVTFDVKDLEDDLTEVLTFTTEDVGAGFGPTASTQKAAVNVIFPNGKTSNPITIGLPADKDSTTYQAVVNTDGAATASKYNPVTTKMEGKVNTSGKYTVMTNEVDFSDISNKSAEMQRAIRYLASKGIITGTSSTTFSPDGSISRAEIAALIVRALGWNDIVN